jgi:uncharacterized membrane protein YtjA (UPF0391 family)
VALAANSMTRAHADCRSTGSQISLVESAMLKWALIFAVIAIIAGLFGFTGIAAGAATIARFLCFVFVALFVLALIFGASLFK